MDKSNKEIRSTTVICVKKNGQTAIGGDGQVTFGDTILKSGARKVRKVYHNKVITGFAGSVADAFTLFEKFESKLEEYNGNLERSAVELTKEWRSDKILRRLEAMLIVGNKEKVYLLSGIGDVIEPDEGILAIGSGGSYAYAAAKALYNYTDLSAKEIVKESLNIAGNICIYTNANIVIEEL